MREIRIQTTAPIIFSINNCISIFFLNMNITKPKITPKKLRKINSLSKNKGRITGRMTWKNIPILIPIFILFRCCSLFRTPKKAVIVKGRNNIADKKVRNGAIPPISKANLVITI